MSQKLKQTFSDPARVLSIVGAIAGVTLLVLFLKRIYDGKHQGLSAPSAPKGEADGQDKTIFSGITAGHVGPNPGSGPNGPDVGRDTYKLLYTSDENKLRAQNTNTSLNLPAPVTPPGPEVSPLSSLDGTVGSMAAFQRDHAIQNQIMFNSDDINIDPRILKQWAVHEAKYQENTTPQRNGQFWAKNWEAWGPLDPFTPRHKNPVTGEIDVTPGPTDPQLAYASALVASMDDQARKFCISENLNDVTYQYRNQLQQIPGSHFETFDASWDAHDTPMVVNRRAHLPQMAARWVVMQLNEKFRKEHPCFSLSGREHFELSNPPQACGSGVNGTNQKENPITLIRVFESRLLKLKTDDPVRQKLYLTLEIGNHVSAGSGGMFHTVVSIDDRGNFVDYTTPTRDKKQTFVLPRTRTDAS